MLQYLYLPFIVMYSCNWEIMAVKHTGLAAMATKYANREYVDSENHPIPSKTAHLANPSSPLAYALVWLQCLGAEAGLDTEE